jgi:hypothetical protein
LKHACGTAKAKDFGVFVVDPHKRFSFCRQPSYNGKGNSGQGDVLMNDNREDRYNKLIIWTFVGSVLICTLSVAIYMYLILF